MLEQMMLKTKFFALLAWPTMLNVKINEVKGKITRNTNLGTTAALTTVENKILGIGNLVKKGDTDAEIKHITDNYFTTSDYNKFTNNILDVKITAKKLVNEYGMNKKIKTATKEEIKK